MPRSVNLSDYATTIGEQNLLLLSNNAQVRGCYERDTMCFVSFFASKRFMLFVSRTLRLDLFTKYLVFAFID